MTKPEASEILEKLTEQDPNPVHVESLDQVIELLQNNHDIQSQFGSWRPNSSGMLAGFKNMILTKLSNVVVAVSRPAIRKQEKFNQLTLQALKLIHQQNEARRSQPN
jgi:hypothetical protein